MTTKKTSKIEQKLLKAIRSENQYVRSEAARHRNATPEVLMVAMRSKHAWVRNCAAGNRNATPEVLLVAMRDKDEDVRNCAARNPNATPEVLMVAMRSKDKAVRRGVAFNPNIKSLNLSTDKWLELVAEDFFEGSLKNVPPHVKKDPRYKSSRLLSQLAKKS